MTSDPLIEGQKDTEGRPYKDTRTSQLSTSIQYYNKNSVDLTISLKVSRGHPGYWKDTLRTTRLSTLNTSFSHYYSLSLFSGRPLTPSFLKMSDDSHKSGKILRYLFTLECFRICLKHDYLRISNITRVSFCMTIFLNEKKIVLNTVLKLYAIFPHNLMRKSGQDWGKTIPQLITSILLPTHSL